MSVCAKGNRSGRNWTTEEESILREIWGVKKDAEVAEHLGRGVGAVRLKASQLDLVESKGRRSGVRSGSVSRSWSKEEDNILIKNIGHLSIFELMELLPRRNRSAIERRCYRLGFSTTQGTYTRLQLVKETGYDWRQIQRAREAIGQNWKRYGARNYMLTFDQVQEIIAYLGSEERKWSLQYGLDACVKCGADGDDYLERHSGEGLCKSCFDARKYNRSMVISRFNKGMAASLTEEVWKGCVLED